MKCDKGKAFRPEETQENTAGLTRPPILQLET